MKTLIYILKIFGTIFINVIMFTLTLAIYRGDSIPKDITVMMIITSLTGFIMYTIALSLERLLDDDD